MADGHPDGWVCVRWSDGRPGWLMVTLMVGCVSDDRMVGLDG